MATRVMAGWENRCCIPRIVQIFRFSPFSPLALSPLRAWLSIRSSRLIASPFFPWHRIHSIVRTTAMTRAALRLISPLGYAAVWIPAVALAAATLVFWCTDLDLSMVRPFFSGDPAADIAVRFPLGTQQPWKSLHDWGVYPALLLGCGGIVVWVVSFFWLKIESWRDPGLFFALVLIVGPGLLVNCVFKPFWSRPRPHALSEFKSCNNPDDPPRDFVPLFRRAFGGTVASARCNTN